MNFVFLSEMANFASKNNEKMKKLLIPALASISFGCTPRQQIREQSPIRVETQVVHREAVVAQRNYVGAVEEEMAAALSFPVGGTVSRILFHAGQFVRQGDLLMELDATSARQSYDAAKATLEQAQDACGRLKKLHDENSLPEIQWVEAQTKLRQAEAGFAIAEKNLADCRLYAPFSGAVGKRIATVGETALPGVPVMTLLRIAAVYVRFAVPEREIGAMRSDDRIEVRVAALGDKTFVATGIEKGASADAVTHAYDVRASIPNAAYELLPGMVCDVRTAPADTLEEAVVPLRAVRQAGDGRRFVWVVRGDSVVRASVEVGRLIDDRAVIERGIADGDRIVVGGMQKIGDGSKVVWE